MSWVWDGPKQSPAFKAKAIVNRERGLCGCGRQPVDPHGNSFESRYCAKCLPHQREHRRQVNKLQREQPDRCKRCGKRFAREVPGNRTCARCHAEETQRTARRKSQTGACRNCAKPLPTGWRLRLCEPCRDRDNERRQAKRATHRGPESPADANRRHGLCECGKPRAHGRTDCTPCRNAKSAARRQAAKDAGLCSRCFKAPAIEGTTWCGSCSAHCKTRYEQRRAGGQCCHCAERPAVPGGTRCEPCRETHRKNLARRYQHAKAEGLCTACRLHPPRPGRVECEGCAAKHQGRCQP